MARWIFVRHGESTANAEGTLAGWRDVPLTEAGRAQAIEVGKVLAQARFDAVVASDLTRASQTAELAMEAWQHHTGRSCPPVQLAPGIRERTVGEWEGQSRHWLRAQGHMDVLITWQGRPPGGESHANLAGRVVPALEPWLGQDTLFFCHGGVIRVVLGLLDRSTFEEIGRVRIANAFPHERQVDTALYREIRDRVLPFEDRVTPPMAPHD